MALWPFGKNKHKERDAEPNASDAAKTAPAADEAHTAPSEPEAASVEGTSGPFDGDSVDIEEFNFSDFASGVLDLGSLKIPLPKGSQVQVEMGEQGPKMLHIVTTAGRITPVAFAAPNSAGQWETASDEIAEGMTADGMPATFEQGPWGREVVGKGEKNTIRIIGVEGPRWMLRLTLATPNEKADEIIELGRAVAARVFVYRGAEPILAGNSLPVVLPPELVEQVNKAAEQRKQNSQQQQSAQSSQKSQANADVLDTAQALRDLQARNNKNK